MKKLSFKLMALAFATTAVLFSCGGNEEAVETETNTVEEVEIETDNMTEEVTYMLPSPLQIVSLFKNAGLEYVGGLTNPKENVNNYNSKYNQKLNFGVYAADMAYSITNNQSQEAINYLNSLRQLSEKIWLTDVINTMGVSERLEKNVGSEDSLVSIMADMQMDLDDYLEENGSSYTGSVIFAGAWIESMYLALNANSNNKEKLTVRLSEQATILENIIGAVKQANEDHDYDELVASLESLYAIFSDISEETNVLSNEKIETLKTSISELRTKIING
ncbi:MAG: hypothetical protein KDD29_07170 [Flavobacteriales bacterium]|nr:hypothetical protein [Flavobacteriales bacterium]